MRIEKLKKEHTDIVFLMMRDFYDSPALIHKSSDRVLRRDIEDCVSGNPFIEGYVFIEDEKIVGYSMVSKSYTTEYGGICIWVEDIYFVENARRKGYGMQYFEFLEKEYDYAVRFKLEVEEENESAIAAYKKAGYDRLGYHIMSKEIDKDIV